MVWTLQKYIFREMGKSFLLTAVGLVAVLGLGGGVLNMIELEGVSALQLLKIMALILPVAATLTLPIAALYAATVTYGRLSADNEFVACRSGGINIHVLFLPTLVISLVSAICSFFFINFVIPGMIMNIDQYVGADLSRIIKQKLATPGRLALNRDRYRIYADKSVVVEDDHSDATRSGSELRLEGVAFVEMNENNWTKFGTAEAVTIEFGHRGGEITIAAAMHNVTAYDAKAGRYSRHEREAFGEHPIPQSIPLKVKWLNLGDLLQYRRQPSNFPEIERDLANLRAGMARALFYDQIRDEFAESIPRHQDYGQVTIGDSEVSYTIQAPRLEANKEDGAPLFESGPGMRVTVLERRSDGSSRTVTADLANVEVARTPERKQVSLQVSGKVAIQDSRAPDRTIRRDREKFDPVSIPEPVIRRAMAFPDSELLNPAGPPLDLRNWVREKRKEVIAEVQEVSRDITGVLHSRLAFSLSVFVLVILGAALGIVFRGAHVLTAFGISFIPSLFVITMIIMGKQLIDKPDTTEIGVWVIWLGIALVAAGDLFVLMRVVRR